MSKHLFWSCSLVVIILFYLGLLVKSKKLKMSITDYSKLLRYRKLMLMYSFICILRYFYLNMYMKNKRISCHVMIASLSLKSVELVFMPHWRALPIGVLFAKIYLHDCTSVDCKHYINMFFSSSTLLKDINWFGWQMDLSHVSWMYCCNFQFW